MSGCNLCSHGLPHGHPSVCTICKKLISHEEYLANDMLCDECAEKPEKFPLASTDSTFSLPGESQFERFCREQATWSDATFGTPQERGPIGPLKHLAKEVQEAIESYQQGDHDGLHGEIVDCLFLTLDSARRSGLNPQQLLEKAFAKLEINRKRTWSKPTSDEPVEHVRATGE